MLYTVPLLSKINYTFLLYAMVVTLMMGCTTKNPVSQVENRMSEMRVYDINNTQIMEKLIISVLQDDGFTLVHSDYALGYFEIEKRFKVSLRDLNLKEQLILGPALFYQSFLFFDSDATIVLTGSISVNKFQDKHQIRVVFNHSEVISRIPLYSLERNDVADNNLYKRFFEKLDKALFLHKHGL